ncbi:MAG: ribonuclease D, partial [Rhodospirillales bacterium]|nr:ribonuclease D [Rhodospirillales bacterium]
MSVITNSKVLANLCKRLSEATFVTVDTEFLREKTFWPHLCLVQVAGPDDVAAIDPLADGIDLTPLFDLLSNPKVLKVFHAARQDLEIFHHMTGKVPAPMFDTQVAAMVCGFGDSVSYETLVNRLAKGKIDKSSRFTDWSHRPLSTKQINYALADVIHLRPIYEKLKRKLDESGR